MKPTPHTVAATPTPKPAARTTKPTTAHRYTLDGIEITNEPIPATRRPMTGSKYGAFFAKLKPGQLLKCPPDMRGSLCGALRKHLLRHGMAGYTARSVADYGDGMARVWIGKAAGK